MKKMPRKNLTRLATAAAAMLLVASVAPFLARAQTKYANDTFTVVSRSDGERVRMHLEGRGDHCWATTSDDRGIGISMGDSECTMRDEGPGDGASLYARIEPTKITFRLNGKPYSVSDPTTVKSARSLFDPLVKVEEQQSELGRQQRALGEKQRDFGRQQREVKVPVPDMSADFQKVETDAKRLSSQGGTQSELGDLQSEIGDLQSRLGDLQSQAGDVQSKIGDQQSRLGDQQSALGDKQSALGDQSEKIATDIAGKLRAMLTQAVQSGAAKGE